MFEETVSIGSISTKANTVIQQVSTSQSALQTLPLQEQNQESKRRHDDIIAQYELQKASRNIIIPTSDLEVKMALREIKHPISYFGEGPIERRERLRNLTAKIVIESGQVPNFHFKRDNYTNQKDENEYYWFPGTKKLLDFRNQIAQESLKKAKNRIQHQKSVRQTMDPLEEDDLIDQQQQKASNFQIMKSQFSDSSVVTKGVFSPSEQFYATAGGSGSCKIWSIPSCDQVAVLPYNMRVNTIVFHPQATLGMSEKLYGNLVTGSSDGKIFFWQMDLETNEQDKRQKFEYIQAHEDRINNVLFHGENSQYLSSVSHDKTWKLWDLETRSEILHQSGHQKAVYTQSLHPDGSLLFTGDLGGSGMIWDLRTGKSIIPILGHVKQLISSSFSENGYHLATGSDDNTVKLWDLRRKSCFYTIPAHNKLISDLKFQKNGSNFLMTASYDRTCKIWSVKDWSQTQVYENQNCKITSINMTQDCKYMATTTMDREWMFWTKKTEMEIEN